MSSRSGVVIGLKRFFAIKQYERRLMLQMMPLRGQCLEIGVEYGMHAEHMIRVTHPKAMTLVDPWPNGGAEQVKTLLTGLPTELDIRVTTSDEFFGSDDIPVFDYAYIDGDHSEEQAYRDVMNTAKHVRQGGFILGDDYDWPDVRNAVQRAMKDLNGRVRKRWIWRTQFLLEVV